MANTNIAMPKMFNAAPATVSIYFDARAGGARVVCDHTDVPRF